MERWFIDTELDSKLKYYNVGSYDPSPVPFNLGPTSMSLRWDYDSIGILVIL